MRVKRGQTQKRQGLLLLPFYRCAWCETEYMKRCIWLHERAPSQPRSVRSGHATPWWLGGPSLHLLVQPRILLLGGCCGGAVSGRMIDHLQGAPAAVTVVVVARLGALLLPPSTPRQRSPHVPRHLQPRARVLAVVLPRHQQKASRCQQRQQVLVAQHQCRAPCRWH